MTEIDVCPVCGSGTFSPAVSCQDHTVSHETFQVVRCDVCTLLVTSPRPESSALPAYYQSTAYISHQQKAQSAMDRIYLVARQFTLKWKLSLINKYVADQPLTLLDYGCGTGEFVRHIRANNWKSVGYEPSNDARNHAANEIRPFIYGSTQEIRSNAPYSIITLWHVLEHIEELNETVNLLKSLATPGVTIFIAVPNHNSQDAKHYQQYWAGFDVPRHLWHFSIESMKMLLTSHGLKLKKIIPMKLDAYYVSMLSEKYKRQGKASLAGVFKSMIIATKSNLAASTDMQYSSLIYVVGT